MNGLDKKRSFPVPKDQPRQVPLGSQPPQPPASGVMKPRPDRINGDVLDKETAKKIVGDLRGKDRVPRYSEIEHHLMAAGAAGDVLAGHPSGPSSSIALPPSALLAGRGAASYAISSSGGPGSDIVAAMAQRLTALEAKMKAQSDEVAKKSRALQDLQEELKEVKLAENPLVKEQKSEAEMEALKRENERLAQQVEEMESFLSEQGFDWEEIKKKLPPRQMPDWNNPWRVDAPIVRYEMPVIKKTIDELNEIAGSVEIGHQLDGKRIANLKAVESVPITFYQNGITVNNGPFRPYAWQITQAFMQDLVDGYFPYEFKQTYPDGVPLRIVDKTSEPMHSDHASSSAASASSSSSSSSNNNNGSNASKEAAQKRGANIHGMGSIAVQDSDRPNPVPIASSSEPPQPARPMDSEAFLKQLPNTVIKDGKIVQVRDDVSHVLKGSDGQAPPTLTADTPAYKDVQVGRKDREITTLQVRSQTGGSNLILHMYYDDTIADVKKFVSKYRSDRSDFDIRTAVPSRAYTDLSQSLRDAELIPNAVILVRVKQ